MRRLHAAALERDPGLKICLGAVAVGIEIDPGQRPGRRGQSSRLPSGQRDDNAGARHRPRLRRPGDDAADAHRADGAPALVRRRPVFTADREHIHHKLLQLGFSHRQVVITLYAVSALFALLSLFLLWPTGSAVGLVLAVVGTGVWMGVQHLGYLEFGELRRVASKTIEQRQIFINNLAIRRATEELKVAREYDQILRILSAAFGASDFDAVELSQQLIPLDLFDPSTVRGFQSISGRGQEPTLRWKKPGSYVSNELVSAWNLTIDLVNSHNRRCGSMTLYRRYNGRDLQLDINLLTSIFQVSLADGLERVSTQTIQYIEPLQEASFVSAQVS